MDWPQGFSLDGAQSLRVPAKPSDAGHEVSAVASKEAQVFGRSEGVVHHREIIVIGTVVESAAHRKPVTREVQASLDMEIQAHVFRKPVGAGRA
jgi:hypothetical protein